nr:B3/4 domain-containing protein [Pseudoroseomonas vastitatis]
MTIHVDSREIQSGDPAPDSLKDACEFVLAGGPAWADAHLASWVTVYQRFGARPNRTPCSAQALRRRVMKDGGLAVINPVVDLYNAVSLRYAVPIGGENDDAYVGRPHLTLADGTERFDTVADGKVVVENPVLGEVIWRDDIGVTCRRWNWRQGTRTRLDAMTGRMWFILESLGSMPDDALEEAGEMLVSGISRLMPGCVTEKRRIAAAA